MFPPCFVDDDDVDVAMETAVHPDFQRPPPLA